MVTTTIGGVPVVIAQSRRIPTSLRCFSATANSDLLRSQLDRLHAEAESTRAKANSNRLRLLRLSEAAENLREQAAVNVRTGKENDARDLLLQKKKVMQALDKAKARIELLDTLSSKLNEAISVKETQLIGNISLDLEEDGENTSGGIHIVSPKPESTEDGVENDHTHLDSEGIQLIERNVEDYQELLDTNNNVLEDVSIDKPKNLKVQQTAEILEEIRRVRERIANIICKEANIS